VKLEKRPLGPTGFNATILGIGDLSDRKIPLETCVATLRRAMDFGLNLVDTAPNYESGYSETIVGTALKGRRDGMFVIDKIDDLDQPVAPQIEGSFKRLQMDMVDLFVFHEVSKVEQWEKIAASGGGMAQLQKFVDKGSVRFRGISSHHPDVLERALNSGLCDVVMFAIGPFCHRRYLEEILPLAKQKGVGTVCFKTFGAGKLLGDTTGYNQPLETRPRGKFSSGGKEIAGDSELPRMTVAECLHYTLTAGPDVTLLGMSFTNEQDAVMEALKTFRPLSPQQMQQVRDKAVKAIQGKGPAWWDPK
jgi:aryl-alcohol dehydrogenase-like predicted oxidoreductase